MDVLTAPRNVGISFISSLNASIKTLICKNIYADIKVALADCIFFGLGVMNKAQ